MNLDEYRIGRVIVLVLDGHVDEVASASLVERIEAVLQPGTDGIVLDFEGVSDLEVIGVRMLAAAAALARGANADLHLCSLPFKLRQTLAQAGLPGRMPIHARRGDAVSAATKLT